jgi:hypothetical protein
MASGSLRHAYYCKAGPVKCNPFIEPFFCFVSLRSHAIVAFMVLGVNATIYIHPRRILVAGVTLSEYKRKRWYLSYSEARV